MNTPRTPQFLTPAAVRPQPGQEHLHGPSAEAALAEVMAFYERVMEALPAQLAVFSPDGVYEFVTPSAIADPETRDWIVGKTDAEYAAVRGLPPEVVAQRQERVQRVVRTRQSETFEESFTTRTGEVRHFRRHVVPVFNAEGAVQHVLGYGLDITDQRRAEEQLRHSQKMDAIGRLAGGVAHDFNNLLTVIGGFTECLLEDVADEQQRTMLAAIREATDRATELTRQLLSMSRRQVTEPSRVDLGEVVRDTMQMVGRLLNDRVTITMALATGLPSVHADVGQLKQVLMNLAVNARDAMPDGGTLTLATAVVEVGDAPAPRLQGLPPGQWVELTVTDTGTGMSETVKSQIFEPFFTTKPQGKGTGLGLSTVYGIVTQAGGHIAVDSTPGWGSAFRLYFPVAGTHEQAPAEQAPVEVSVGAPAAS
jgi:PAS domain S-box-containing protein